MLLRTKKYKSLGFRRAYGLYSSSPWAFFSIFFLDMFDMFCKVHLRFCFTVYTLFFCFHRHSCRRNKRFQDKKYDLLSKTWSLFFVRFTLRGLFNRALAATCILLFCSLYVSSLVRSFKVSLIDFISSTH